MSRPPRFAPLEDCPSSFADFAAWHREAWARYKDVFASLFEDPLSASFQERQRHGRLPAALRALGIYFSGFLYVAWSALGVRPPVLPLWTSSLPGSPRPLVIYIWVPART